MTLYRAQMVLPMFTGQPEDVVVNTFHFNDTIASFPDVADYLATSLSAFYGTIYGATASGRASYINWPNVTLKVFNLDDPTPRIPLIRTGFFVGAGTQFTSVPTEVAVVASFQSNGISGQPFQRSYNRVFLGGLPSTAMTGSGASSFPTVAPAFQTSVRTAMVNLEARNTLTHTWMQVSTAGGPTVALPVVKGFVDNSPDSQRRRSVKSTSRQTWP